MKKLLLLILVAFASCNQEKKVLSEKNEEQHYLDSLDHRVDSLTNALKSWNYFQYEDEMDGSVTRQAIMYSLNSKELEFPYDSAKALLTVIKLDDKEKAGVGISISDGQLSPGSYSDESLRIKFDQNSPENYKYMKGEDVLWLYDAEGFLTNLQKSDSIKIELDFFQNGREVFSFHTSGLDLERLK